MQVAPGRRVGQGLKVLVRWASAAPQVSYRWLAIWWLSLKAPHPLYPRAWDVEGVVSAPERLNDAPLVSYRGGCVWWLCVASSAPNGAVAEPQVCQMAHLPPRTWAIVAHLKLHPTRTCGKFPHLPPAQVVQNGPVENGPKEITGVNGKTYTPRRCSNLNTSGDPFGSPRAGGDNVTTPLPAPSLSFWWQERLYRTLHRGSTPLDRSLAPRLLHPLIDRGT